MIRMATVMSMVLSVAAASELVVNVGLQQGSFLIGKDIGPLNPHDYRPNEFVTSDVREHLLKPRPHEPSSLTSRVRRSLCTRGSPLGTESTPRAWTGSPARMTTLWPPRWPPAGVRTTMLTLRHPSTTKYEITFALRSGVTFHDGTPWNAAAAKVNFDQIMGGTGEPG